MTRKGAEKAEDKANDSLASATAKLVGANLTALMAAHPDLNSNPKIAKKTGLGTGTISRLRNGDVDANLSTLEKIAKVFDLAPWQLLVPGLNPKNKPVLQPLSEQERRLYAKLAEALKDVQGQ